MVWHASREGLPFKTPGSVFFRLAYAPFVESSFQNLPCLFSTFSPCISIVTFSIVLCSIVNKRNESFRGSLGIYRMSGQRIYRYAVHEICFPALGFIPNQPKIKDTHSLNNCTEYSMLNNKRLQHII